VFVVEVRTRLAFKEKEKEAAEPVLVDVPEAASRSWNLASCRSAVTSASMSVWLTLLDDTEKMCAFVSATCSGADMCAAGTIQLARGAPGAMKMAWRAAVEVRCVKFREVICF
jgi:hypothetical protein